MGHSLFDRFGGPAVVSRLVFSFYDRVLGSERLALYFRDVDMRRLVEHQAKFVSQIMGGPLSYSNAELRQVHAHLDIDDADFDEMMRLFEQALRDCAMSDAEVGQVMAGMRAGRPFIVKAGRSAQTLPAEPAPTDP